MDRPPLRGCSESLRRIGARISSKAEGWSVAGPTWLGSRPRSDVVKAVVGSLGRDTCRRGFAAAIEAASPAVLARRKPERPLNTNLERWLLEALEIPLMLSTASSRWRA